MDNSTLTACGRALYGQQWQSALARDLCVSDRTMRRWAAGTHRIPERLEDELIELLSDRSRVSRELICRLRRAIKSNGTV